MYVALLIQMPQMPSKYRAELVNLIKAMLNRNPDKRPSINRILRDPYIKENIARFLEGTRPRSV
jgi:NIMA (never in mitosis gene a)-related kinase 1/4/5